MRSLTISELSKIDETVLGNMMEFDQSKAKIALQARLEEFEERFQKSTKQMFDENFENETPSSCYQEWLNLYYSLRDLEKNPSQSCELSGTTSR